MARGFGLASFKWFMAVLISVFALVSACAAVGESDERDDDDSGSGASSQGGAGVGGFNATGGNGEGNTLQPPVAWVTGTVLAPEGTIPIHEAVVYATQETPDAIPQQVYCDRCVELTVDDPYTLTEPDGSFMLGVPYTGNWKLVVQKGAFRKVSDIIVPDGTTPVEPSTTVLPGASSPGNDIPKMAVVDASYDSIKNTLAKLGLGQVDGSGDLINGSEQFDLYADGSSLLTNYAELSQYHIVFFGCDDSWPNTYLDDPMVIDNLRNFVQEGGKLYVTDWSYDILKRAFINEAPLSWLGDNGSYDSAHQGIYDAAAIVNDPDMAAWLAVQGITSFTLLDNWTILSGTNQYSAMDEDGMTQSFTPTTWISSSMGPNTVSYQFGCGRAMFSTYHTEATFGATLTEQELALLYIILEVNVCVGDIEPPQ